MSDLPNLKRDSTMAVTMQEGEAFLKSQGIEVTDDEVKTRAQKELLSEIVKGVEPEENNGKEEVVAGEEDSERPKVTRKGTMAVTAEEGKDLLGSEERLKTRGQTATIAEEEEEESAPPKVARDSTMAVTAQEAEQLLGGEQLQKTRGQTAAKDHTSPAKDHTSPAISPAKGTSAASTPSKTTPKTTPTKTKRTNTIVQTAEDGAYILGSSGELGRTRSQTRKLSESSDDKKPSVKRSGTMAQTAKEGEEFLERESKRPKFQLQEDEEELKAGEEGQAMVTTN